MPMSEARRNNHRIGALRHRLGLPRRGHCSGCQAAPAVPGQRYCKPCHALAKRRCYLRAKAYAAGQRPRSALPTRKRVSWRYFVRTPPRDSQAFICRSLGRRGQRQLQAHLADLGIPVGTWMSWLGSHGQHRQHGQPWRRDCPICTRVLGPRRAATRGVGRHRRGRWARTL
jgi:hypothetical protein